MRYDITPETVAQVIYHRIICPTRDPQNDVNEWVDMTSGLGASWPTGNGWLRVARGYEAQTAVLTKALFQAQNITR